MNWESRLQAEVSAGLAPDPWNPAWRQVPRFGAQMAVELEVGELLAGIVRATKPKVIIETGTYKGFSTLMIASALKRNEMGHLYTMDLNDWNVLEECRKFELDPFVTFIKGDSRLVIREILPKIEKIDFLWLDADHTKKSIVDELEAALPALRPGTLVAFHDTILFQEEADAIKEIEVRFPEWQSIGFRTSRGFHLMKVV